MAFCGDDVIRLQRGPELAEYTKVAVGSRWSSLSQASASGLPWET